jgi:hypothetical protein
MHENEKIKMLEKLKCVKENRFRTRALWINLISKDQVVLENEIILIVKLGPEHSGLRCVINNKI